MAVLSVTVFAFIYSSHIVSTYLNKRWGFLYSVFEKHWEVSLLLIFCLCSSPNIQSEWKESQNRPVLEHFLIVNEALQGSLPKLEGQWWRLVRTEGAEREKGLAVGILSPRGPLNPIGPPPTCFAEYWIGQQSVTVTSTRVLNERLTLAFGFGEPVLLAGCSEEQLQILLFQTVKEDT